MLTSCAAVAHRCRFRWPGSRFEGSIGVVELESGEALLGRLLEVLHQALVARVVRDDQLKIGVRVDQFALLVERQRPPVVGQRVDDHRRVLTRFDDFVQIADGADTRRGGQRAVEPARAVGFEQVAADQVGGGHVFVAGDGDQRLARASRPCIR
jgi:hypothetical protein